MDIRIDAREDGRFAAFCELNGLRLMAEGQWGNSQVSFASADDACSPWRSLVSVDLGEPISEPIEVGYALAGAIDDWTAPGGAEALDGLRKRSDAYPWTEAF